MNPLDPEMLELFRAEMDTHLPVLSRGLLALEKGELSAAEIEAMMRAAHSIKGAARIVGIEPAVRVSHAMEDVFTLAKEKRIAITSAAVDGLLEGVDGLERICSPGEGQPLTDAALEALLAKLAAVRDGTATTRETHAAEAQALSQPGGAQPVPSPAQVLAGSLVAGKAQRCELTIALPAQWDDAGAQSLRRQMIDSLALSPTRLTLDFTSTSRLPARAVAMLASLAQAVARVGSSPAVHATGAAPAVQSVLRISGLSATWQTMSASP